MAKKKSTGHHVQKSEHTTHHKSKAGHPHPHKGHPQSAETRAKISDALKGKKRG